MRASSGSSFLPDEACTERNVETKKETIPVLPIMSNVLNIRLQRPSSFPNKSKLNIKFVWKLKMILCVRLLEVINAAGKYLQRAEQKSDTKAVFVLYLFRFRNINQGWNTRSFSVNRNRNTIPVSVDKPAQGWFIKPKPVYVCARRQQKWMGRALHVCTKKALYKDRVTMNFFAHSFLFVASLLF